MGRVIVKVPKGEPGVVVTQGNTNVEVKAGMAFDLNPGESLTILPYGEEIKEIKEKSKQEAKVSTDKKTDLDTVTEKKSGFLDKVLGK